MKISIGMPKNVILTDEEAALHEAGHAVISEYLGIEIASVYLTTPGHGATEPYSDMCSPDDYRWAIIACAGSVAENVNWINDGDFSGVKNAKLSEKDLLKLFEETKIYVKTCSPVIKQVASLLLQKRELFGKEIKNCLTKSNIEKLELRK